MNKKNNIAKRAERILEIAKNMARCLGLHVENRIEEIQLHYDGYAEPGYSSVSGLVATGNWNVIDEYDSVKKMRVKISDLPARISNLFEKMGIECEWSDQWSDCSECGKLFRTDPDCHSWLPSFVVTKNCDHVCHECVRKDPEFYLSEMEGNSDNLCTIRGINPGNYGYIKIADERNDSSDKIEKELSQKKVHRFLYNIDSVGQSDAHWGVYVHESEMHLIDSSYKKAHDEIEPMVVCVAEVKKIEIPCKFCKTSLWENETPCWKCGTDNPTK